MNPLRKLSRAELEAEYERAKMYLRMFEADASDERRKIEEAQTQLAYEEAGVIEWRGKVAAIEAELYNLAVGDKANKGG